MLLSGYPPVGVFYDVLEYFRAFWSVLECFRAGGGRAVLLSGYPPPPPSVLGCFRASRGSALCYFLDTPPLECFIMF